VELRGVGDRWMAGETVAGVEFAVRQAVTITGGARAGERGTVLLLVDVAAEPVYFVELRAGAVVRVRQSQLRADA
jgi:hypothetical protein